MSARGMTARLWRRRIQWTGALAIVLGAIVAACGDDDSTVAPGNTGVDGGDANSGDGGNTNADTGSSTEASSNADADAGDVTDAPINVDLDAPGDDAEAASRQPDAAEIEAGAPCPGLNPCDCDNDGYESEGGACAGNDCNDRDPLRHPNQTYVSDPPDPGADGNWNCVNGVEKQYAVNLNCSAIVGCTGEGFSGDPPCGTDGAYVACKPPLLGLLCSTVAMGTRTQGCK